MGRSVEDTGTREPKNEKQVVPGMNRGASGYEISSGPLKRQRVPSSVAIQTQ